MCLRVYECVESRGYVGSRRVGDMWGPGVLGKLVVWMSWGRGYF